MGFLNRVLVSGMVGLLLLASAALTEAQAGPRFSLAGAGQRYVHTGAPTDIGYGGGILLGFNLGQKTTFEFGGIYLSRSENASVYIPGNFQFWLGKGAALELGMYFDQSLETGGGNTYGALGGLRFQFGKFFLNPRYHYGLKKDAFTSEFMLLAGFTFGGKK
jgi:hypothetical protein